MTVGTSFEHMVVVQQTRVKLKSMAVPALTRGGHSLVAAQDATGADP